MANVRVDKQGYLRNFRGRFPVTFSHLTVDSGTDTTPNTLTVDPPAGGGYSLVVNGKAYVSGPGGSAACLRVVNAGTGPAVSVDNTLGTGNAIRVLASPGTNNAAVQILSQASGNLLDTEFGLDMDGQFRITSGKLNFTGTKGFTFATRESQSNAWSNGGSITITNPSGVLTFTGLTIAANSVQSMTLNYTRATTNMLPFMAIQKYTGTYVTNGIPSVIPGDPVNNTSLTIRVLNIHATNALNGDLTVAYMFANLS